jgi:hypothetical protein
MILFCVSQTFIIVNKIPDITKLKEERIYFDPKFQRFQSIVARREL